MNPLILTYELLASSNSANCGISFRYLFVLHIHMLFYRQDLLMLSSFLHSHIMHLNYITSYLPCFIQKNATQMSDVFLMRHRGFEPRTT